MYLGERKLMGGRASPANPSDVNHLTAIINHQSNRSIYRSDLSGFNESVLLTSHNMQIKNQLLTEMTVKGLKLKLEAFAVSFECITNI